MGKYLVVKDKEDTRYIELYSYPDELDDAYLWELRDSFEFDGEYCVVRLHGGGSNPLKKLSSPNFTELARDVRLSLVRNLFRDVIYIGEPMGNLYGHAVEILLSMDYVVHRWDVYLSLENYLPLLSGYSNIMFRGGTPLLNLLGKGMGLGELCWNGYFRCVDRLDIDLSTALGVKGIERELYLRNYFHLLGVEDRILRRILYSV